ncbi:MAG: Hpt domain-containing protein [Bryobacteraceae bacterium]
MEVEPFAEILDREALLERIGDDAGFLLELAQMFCEQRAQLLGEIRSAMEAGDAPALARAAHTLKGCVGNLGAGRAFEAARKLEMLARNQQLEDARCAAPELEREVARFEQALLRLAEELNRA